MWYYSIFGAKTTPAIYLPRLGGIFTQLNLRHKLYVQYNNKYRPPMAATELSNVFANLPSKEKDFRHFEQLNGISTV
jgi:hypothetical protein